MTLRCQESVPLLGPYLDGELEAEDRAWVDEHLGGCAACRTRKALLAAQRDAIRNHVVARAAGADLSRLTTAVMQRVSRQRPSPPVSVWGRELWRAHRVRISTAAALAVAASVAAIVAIRPLGRGAPAASQPVAQIVSIDEVDFVDRPGMVLQSGQTAIIWLSKDQAQP